MQKISDLYKNDPYEIRLKAPLLKDLLLFMSIMLFSTLIDALLNGKIELTIMVVIVIAVLGYCFILLSKGRYTLAATLFIYTLTALSVINGVMQITMAQNNMGEQSYAITSLLNSIILFLAVLFASGKKDLLIIIIILGLSFIFGMAISVFTGRYTVLTVSLSQQLILPLISFTVNSILSVLLRQFIDKVLNEALTKITQSEEQSSKMRTLAQEASERLLLAQSMEKQAEETFVSVQDIDVQIQDIMKNLGILDEKYHLSLDSLTMIGEKIGSLDKVSEKQSQNIQETSTALEEMVASISSVSAIMGTKMKSVNQLRQRAEEGVQNIDTTSASFTQVLEHLDSIKQMITLISGIASKTNLLAMNAAIEAAHAGMAGRGFAVVADEVRKLAETSASSAKQVSVTLKQLISSIEETGLNVNNSGESFKSISQEVNMVGLAMNEIEASIKELSLGSNEIISASTSMNELNREVINAVKVTREQEIMTQTNVTSLGEFVRSLDDSMKRIDLGTDQIHIAVDDLKGKTGSINSFVKEFAGKLM